MTIALLRPAAALLALLATGAGFPDHGRYAPSSTQSKVDRSFSDISIERPFSEVDDRLTMVIEDDCADVGECEWRDADGVRYSLWGDPGQLYVVVKTIEAAEFPARAIPALDIGAARRRDQVLATARRFVPNADFDCHDYDDVTEACTATLDPGWVTIVFDAAGMLQQVRLDGYHFT